MIEINIKFRCLNSSKRARIVLVCRANKVLQKASALPQATISITKSITLYNQVCQKNMQDKFRLSKTSEIVSAKAIILDNQTI